jgi:hypothetical protein
LIFSFWEKIERRSIQEPCVFFPIKIMKPLFLNASPNYVIMMAGIHVNMSRYISKMNKNELDYTRLWKQTKHSAYLSFRQLRQIVPTSPSLKRGACETHFGCRCWCRHRGLVRTG